MSLTESQCLTESPAPGLLDVVAARRSYSVLAAPGPGESQLHRILLAAASAPDYGRLRPWRFTVFTHDARAEFGEVLVAAALRRDPQITEGRLAVERQRFLRAPVVVAVGAHLTDGPVGEAEQLAAVAAATQNLMLAATALGYGTIWRTGPAARDESVKAALGLRERDAIVGFVYLGTPFGTPASRPTPALDGVVSHWSGTRTTHPR
jgi:nitroreductase